MGYLSHITGQDIDNIIEAGQALAFVVYPFAVTTIPYGPVWAVLFFFMLILLGIDSTVIPYFFICIVTLKCMWYLKKFLSVILIK